MTVVLYVLMGIIILIFLLAAIAPKTYHVNRSVLINKPLPEVFSYLKSLRNQDEWSVWAKKDPDMEKSFRGVDGTLGATSIWKGNKDVGAGEQEITNIQENEIIECELRFLKPFKSTSDCYFKVEAVNPESTSVVWGFSGKNVFPMSIMMLFMNMDKAVGADFESGLANLKAILESR